MTEDRLIELDKTSIEFTPSGQQTEIETKGTELRPRGKTTKGLTLTSLKPKTREHLGSEQREMTRYSRGDTTSLVSSSLL